MAKLARSVWGTGAGRHLTIVVLLIAAAAGGGLSAHYATSIWSSAYGDNSAPCSQLSYWCVEATAYAGAEPVRAQIRNPRVGVNELSVTAHRNGSWRPVNASKLSIGPLPNLVSEPTKADIQPDGSHISATIPEPGSWLLTVGSASFVFRVWRSGQAAALYPALKEQDGRYAGTLRLGRRYASVVIAEQPLTLASSFQVRVTGSYSPLSPIPLIVSTNMIDMDMGRTEAAASEVDRNLYLASARFSMGGLWTVELRTPTSHTSAVVDVATRTHASKKNGGMGFVTPRIHTPLPYTGYITEMANDRLARFNGGSAFAGTTPHDVYAGPGNHLYVTDTGDNVVREINPKNGKTIRLIPTGLGPVHMVFAPHSDLAVVSNFLSASVSIIDLRTGRQLKTIPVGLNPHFMAIDPSGRYAYVPCLRSGGVWVVNIAKRKVVKAIPTGLEPYAVAAGPAGSHKVFVSDWYQNQLDVISTVSWKVIDRIKLKRNPAWIALAPDGRLFVTENGSNMVAVVNTATDQVLAQVPAGNGAMGLAVTPDGKYVYIADNNADRVTIVSVRTDKPVGSFAVPGLPNGVAF